MYRYIPLVVLIFVAMLAGGALTQGAGGGVHAWMHFFMGFFLVQFAMLKLFHIRQFVSGFQMYDIVAQKTSLYAYLYPFIELCLGLAYLSFFYPVITYIVTMLVMGIGAVGVIQALRKGLNLKCACMGTVLDVPLSTVTLTEDIGMGLMACFMLFSRMF